MVAALTVLAAALTAILSAAAVCEQPTAAAAPMLAQVETEVSVEVKTQAGHTVCQPAGSSTPAVTFKETR